MYGHVWAARCFCSLTRQINAFKEAVVWQRRAPELKQGQASASKGTFQLHCRFSSATTHQSCGGTERQPSPAPLCSHNAAVLQHERGPPGDIRRSMAHRSCAAPSWDKEEHQTHSWKPLLLMQITCCDFEKEQILVKMFFCVCVQCSE